MLTTQFRSLSIPQEGIHRAIWAKNVVKHDLHVHPTIPGQIQSGLGCRGAVQVVFDTTSGPLVTYGGGGGVILTFVQHLKDTEGFGGSKLD